MKTLARFTVVVGLALAGCRAETFSGPMTVTVEFAELGASGHARAVLDADANTIVRSVVSSSAFKVSVGSNVHSGPLLMLGDVDAHDGRWFAARVHDFDFRTWTAQRAGKQVAVLVDGQLLTEFTVSAPTVGVFMLPEPRTVHSVPLAEAIENAIMNQPFDGASP